MVKLDRRDFIIMGGGALMLALADRILPQGLIDPIAAKVEDTVAPAKPNEIFFQVADAFGVDRSNPQVAAYMQPPIVRYNTNGCPSGTGGCTRNYEVSVGDGQKGIVAHEMGHSILDKYGDYLAEVWYVENWKQIHADNPYYDFDIDMARKVGTYESYPGYPPVRTMSLPIGVMPKHLIEPISSTFHEFVAFVAENEVGGRRIFRPEYHDATHKPGATLYWHAVDLYGRPASLKIAGTLIKSSTPERDMSEGNVRKCIKTIDDVADELGL